MKKDATRSTCFETRPRHASRVTSRDMKSNVISPKKVIFHLATRKEKKKRKKEKEARRSLGWFALPYRPSSSLESSHLHILIHFHLYIAPLHIQLSSASQTLVSPPVAHFQTTQSCCETTPTAFCQSKRQFSSSSFTTRWTRPAIATVSLYTTFGSQRTLKRASLPLFRDIKRGA